MTSQCSEHNSLMAELRENNGQMRKLIELLIGDANGSVGLVERVRSLEKWVGALQKLVWAGGLSVVAIVMGYFMRQKLGF